MSTFQALNIDYDQVTAEQDIDDTKELQIEDALKLYQTALKHHADGPQSYEQALEAYKELFTSDIFKYPESQTELARAETFPEYEEMWIENFQPGPTLPVVNTETAPNTLSHLVYLSYKNHGRLLLDLLQWKTRGQATTPMQAIISQADSVASAKEPLQAFSEALDKDDTDTELWRSSATVAQLMGCNRIARFCLEAVLDMGEESLDDILGLPNPEQSLSRLRLKEMATQLQDDLTLALTPLPDRRRRKLGEALIRRLETHMDIPKPTFGQAAYSKIGHLGRQPLRYMMLASKRDWAAVGEVILQQQTLIESGMVDTGPGIGIGINFPDMNVQELERSNQLALPERPRSAGKPSALEVAEPLNTVEPPDMQEAASKTKSIITASEPAVESAEPAQPTEPPRATSRKRSPDSAELPEDDGRGRSKRTRTRDQIDKESSKPDAAKVNAEWQLNIYKESDEWLFEKTDIFLQKLHLPEMLPPEELKTVVESDKPPSASDDNGLRHAIRSFYTVATCCTPEIAGILNNGLNNENIDSFGAASREAGLNAFLGSTTSRASQACARFTLEPTEKLEPWVEHVNANWYYPKEAALHFLFTLLRPGSFPDSGPQDPSSYITHRWSEDLKRCVVQIAVRFDEEMYKSAEGSIAKISARELKANGFGLDFVPSQAELNDIELAQTLFELHLDVYSLIKRPGTTVDAVTRYSQKDRLERWSSLANVAINLRIGSRDEPETDDLALRHIWATAFHISVCDDVTQEHIFSCMKDLKALLTSLNEPCVHLQNNAVIPEISMSAIEQELSKINMKDFFAKIFSDKEEDPVDTIESLEPLLEDVAASTSIFIPSKDDSAARQSSAASPTSPKETDAIEEDTNSSEDPTPQEQMGQFLSRSSWTLRLSLWQRLRQAYKAIDYLPKIASCHLRSIELLTKEMITVSDGSQLSETKKLEYLRWFHLIDQFVQKLLQLHSTSSDIWECVDFQHLKSSIVALTHLAQMLHSFHIYEDQVRVNALPAPTFEGKTKPSFMITAKWMHNLQLRVWMLLYRLFQEAIEQDPESYESPAEVRFEFLRTLHYAMGQRKICYAANRELLRLLLDEMLNLSDLEYSDLELSQVVYDLYDLKFWKNPLDLMDHECSEHEVLNRKAALKLLGFFMAQAHKVSMKDMPKSEIKGAVDKVQGALGKGKMTIDLHFNSRMYSDYMKGPINPLDIYAALRGTFEIPMKPIPETDAPVASKGWYFLLGSIALNKFKSVKRIQPGTCEDLMTAAAFFRQDIEYSSDHWETWYRLAQVNDLQLEEHVSWSAEKMNAHSHEIFHYQRHSLHAYVMAVSGAVRFADDSPRTNALLAELYADFGNRIYASSREPFSMLAFGFQDKEERHFSGEIMYQRPPFNPLQVFTAWRLAAVLFRRSIARAPDVWSTHYMLGKFLWKMYNHDIAIGSPDAKHRPSCQEVVSCFVTAVEKLPKPNNRKEPILEPHYKLVAIIYKLVQRKDISAFEAQTLIKTSSYTNKVTVFDSETEHDSWTAYSLRVLKSIRAADKAGWHHRMTARAAHLLYDDAPAVPVSALQAKNELTQQMFTKTMVLQVWKPEFERPGRHFVYTTRYVRFFVQLLAQLGDRESLSLLVKRLRRKPDQYFDHSRLWGETCLTYLKVLRKIGNIPEGYEDAVFKSLNHDEFTLRSTKLEIWCKRYGVDNETERNVTFEVLCDVIELKKLNNGLMKATLVDDLLGDTYAKLYEEIGPNALSGIVLPNEEGTIAGAQAPPKPMALTNVMNVDGATDSAAPSRPASTDPAPASRARKTGVGRREIQRKAEAAANRPSITTSTETKPAGGTNAPLRSTSATSVSTPGGVLPSQGSLVQVVIPSPAPKVVGTPSALPRRKSSTVKLIGLPLPGNPFAAADMPPVKQKAPVTTLVHDSDDESELTELDDEPDEPPPQTLRAFGPAGGLFPTIGGKPKLDDGSVASWTTAREGEDAVDEEGGEEDDGDEVGGDDEEAEEGDDEEVPEEDTDAGARDEDGDEIMEDE